MASILKSSSPQTFLPLDKKNDMRTHTKNLRNEQMSIVKFAEYLTIYKKHSKPLVDYMTQMFEEESQKIKGNNLAEKRLLYFYVANETIFKTKEYGIFYIKAFGDRLHDWVDIFTK